MKRTLGLRTALNLLVLIAVIPVFAVVIQSSLAEQRGRVERADANMRSLADLGAANQAQLIEGARQMLTAISHAPPVYGNDAAGCGSYFRDLHQFYPSYANFGLLDLDGDLVCSAVARGASVPSEAVNSRDRLFFRQALALDGFAIGEYNVGRVSGKPTIALSMPVRRPDGSLRGVIFAALDLGLADTQLESMAIPPDSSLLVTDGSGIVLASAGSVTGTVGGKLQEGFALMAATRARDVGGREWIHAVRPVGSGPGGPQGMFVHAMVARDDVLAPATIRLQWQLGALCTIALCAVLCAWKFGDRALAEIAAQKKQLHESYAELSRAKAELEQLNETLENRVAERTRELALANKELESFSYSVSHDLRAPLHVIDGFGRALMTAHAHKLDAKGVHYLDRIQAGTRQMGHLIDDLLSLARVTRTELRLETVDLGSKVWLLVEQLRNRFPQRDVRVEVDNGMLVTGDARLLMVVLHNLVENAWKFTARVPQGSIRVGRCTVPDGKDAPAGEAFFVADNGAGFDMAYGHKLFNAFHRLHGADEFEGTGIGLATVHRVISRHGGRIWAESSPGQGATFYFTLGREGREAA